MEASSQLGVITLEVENGCLSGVVRWSGLFYSLAGVKVGARSMCTSDVLSVVTGVHLSGDGNAALKRVLSYMTGTPWEEYRASTGSCAGSVMEDQRRECREWILRLHPQLEGLSVPTDQRERQEWLSQLKWELGSYLLIVPLPGLIMAPSLRDEREMVVEAGSKGGSSQ